MCVYVCQTASSFHIPDIHPESVLDQRISFPILSQLTRISPSSVLTIETDPRFLLSPHFMCPPAAAASVKLVAECLCC
jgi:hypothetical protein